MYTKQPIQLHWQFPENEYCANLICVDPESITKRNGYIVFPNRYSIYIPVGIDTATLLHKKIAARLLKIQYGSFILVDKVTFKYDHKDECIQIFNQGLRWNPTFQQLVQNALHSIPGRSFIFR